MRNISFKNAALFKRGIWLTAAALIVFVFAPATAAGSLLQDPAPTLFAAAVLGLFVVYVFKRTQVHRLADEVLDLGDHLHVRRSRTEQDIAFANMLGVQVSTFSGIHRITIRLREPTKLGRQIDFLPQASLWSNLAGVNRLAVSLNERADAARVLASMI
jgi:hypothetical protein